MTIRRAHAIATAVLLLGGACATGRTASHGEGAERPTSPGSPGSTGSPAPGNGDGRWNPVPPRSGAGTWNAPPPRDGEEPRRVSADTKELASTQHSGYREKEFVVLRSPAEAQAAWRRMWSAESAVPSFPAVDFSREMLVVAALGERASGGYAVAISDAVVEGAALQVGVVETRPGQGCVTPAVMTSPAVLAKLPRFEGRVELVEFVVSEECAGQRR
jgi:hypothetical protein